MRSADHRPILQKSLQGDAMSMKKMSNVLAVVVLILTLIALHGSAHGASKKRRFRRSVLNFAAMIRCATGRSAFWYINYGCYCGLGGAGKILDGVDRCCFEHDQCYSKLISNGTCRRWQVYLKSYRRSSCTTCSRRNKGCSRDLCQCDSIAAHCFKRNHYNKKLFWINRKKLC